MRTRYLLCYDVRDDRRLRRTAKVAEAWGHRLEYSVFVCDLDHVERACLERALRDVLHLDVDRAFLVDLGPPGRSSARRFLWLTPPVLFPDPQVATIV
jgi:CRISPR-associated protein Cas2